ncbi:hypothetical protein [Aureliella helgolandensis]|uniref:Uncharacterized protein n=1 Tax=Aureliella helgolandensis TaxID=2527968 RepID=A0A518G498_9BACT|nr:hypothetical protein [Aureliella helgolandensis]QDV23424.1 hypothetical protein Q31a_17220 [Aureliella helgolandensis]
MSHLFTTGGHLLRNSGGHLAKCGCICCGSIEFPSGTDYFGGCGDWTGGGSNTYTSPGVVEVCVGTTPEQVAIVERARETSYSKIGEPDKDCSYYEKWKVEIFAYDSGGGVMVCRIKYTLLEISATGDAPINDLAPGGCTYPQCTVALAPGFYQEFGTGGGGGGVFDFEWTPC